MDRRHVRSRCVENSALRYPFFTSRRQAESYDPWVNALQDSGRSPADYRVGIIRSILVTDDKASDWEPVRTSERYRMPVSAVLRRKRGGVWSQG